MARTPRIGQGKGIEHWHALMTRGLGDPFLYKPGVDQTIHDIVVADEPSAACALGTLGAALVGQGYRARGILADGLTIQMVKADPHYVSGCLDLAARVCTYQHKER